MTLELIEVLLGLYFIGISFAIVRTLPNREFAKSVDVFKLIFGISLIVLAMVQGVRFI